MKAQYHCPKLRCAFISYPAVRIARLASFTPVFFVTSVVSG